MKDKFRLISAAFALLFFAACGILTLTHKAYDFSEIENRTLAQFPTLNVKDLVTKEDATASQNVLQNDIEDYLSDQFFCRTGFMKTYALASRLMGKTDYNGTYVCSDDWLIEVYNEPVNTKKNTDRLSKTVDTLNSMGVDTSFILVPTAVSMYPEVLPSNVRGKEGQTEVFNYMYDHIAANTKIDTWSVLESEKKSGTQLYYKTDHHWTVDAAYAVYAEFCKAKGMEAVPKDSFDIEEVSNSFYGTVYSKSLNPLQPADTIKAYKQDMTGISVKYMADPDADSLYAESYLSVKDKYSYFLNGIQPMITIENSNVKNGKTLLVVKDSYANCFVPFLINHYEKVIVLDTRYYRMGVTPAVRTFGVTDCLFLFNLNTLDKEVALAGIY